MDKKILSIVKNVRKTLVHHIEKGNVTGLDFGYNSKLHCACAFGSFISAAVANHLEINLQVVTGTCKGSQHTWNQFGNFYYDSTITQFGYEEYVFPISSNNPKFVKSNRLPVTAKRLKKSQWPLEQLPDGNSQFFVKVVEQVLWKVSPEIELDEELVNEHFTLKKSFI